MNNQNILKYHGTKFDLKLDASEYYDYELGENVIDYDEVFLDLQTVITYDTLVFDSDVCVDLPLENEIGVDITTTNCEFHINKRTEHGWTLEFLFNRYNAPWSNLPWSGDGTFYYWGIKNETEPSNYLDNNLSFSFTPDRKIIWKSYQYSGHCNTGYGESSFILSGMTPSLCIDGTTNDFLLTITFDRYNEYNNCELENEGGLNDLITGWTVTNPMGVLTGDTEEFELIEVLNQQWFNSRDHRKGVLKFYLNGKLIHLENDWSEIIPSQRESLNPLVQIWSGGTSNSGDIHNGQFRFNT